MGVFIPLIFVIAAYVTTAVIIIEAVVAMTLIAIAAAVVAAACTIAATYYYAVGDIQNTMLFAGIAIAAGVGGIYVSYTAQAANAAALMAEGTASAIAAAEAAQTTFAFTVVTYAQSAYATWQSIAEALHLGLIAKMHQIVYLISEDYRVGVDKIFAEVSHVSEAMGWGALSLNLLFENARTLVLDVSSSLGENYDIGQIKWLNTFNGFLKEFNARSNYYKDNPARLISWIADNTYRPAIDAKAGTVRAIFEGIETALGLIKVTAEDVTKFKNDVQKLVYDLPAVIRDQIKPGLDKIINDFDDFVRLNYDPAIKKIDGTLLILGFDLDNQKIKAQELTNRLLRPGKYLAEINDLDETLRREDEDMVQEISTRTSKRDARTIGEGWINPLKDTIKEVTLYEEKQPGPGPDFLKLEDVKPRKEEKIEPRSTWNVGEY